jgi:predicted DNA-binding antitoxin AbrB/MazE fold protein
MTQYFDAVFEDGRLRPLSPIDLREHDVVRVSIEGPTFASKTEDLPFGDGLRSTFGAWAADGDELEEFLKWNRAQRKLERDNNAT